MYLAYCSCVVILFNMDLYKSVFSTYSFQKQVFFFFFFVFLRAFCVFCSEFDAIFMNFWNICIIMIYIVGVRYSVFLLSLITFQLNNLWEQIHVIKTWLQLLTKKHASRVLLGFKNSIHKEKCKIFTNERK